MVLGIQLYIYGNLILLSTFTLDSMVKGLMDMEKIEKKNEKQKSKAKNAKVTKSSPSKRAQRCARRGAPHGRRNFVEIPDMDSDSDSEFGQSAATFTTAHHGRRPPPHDPNTIVLDCDDEFFGGPAVQFTRNIAGANAVSMEQSLEMKVNVRINNKIEQFQMNPVSWC